MRRLERWLHQHIFKVGWLLTKNLRTTTVLYYTFFLPGVVLDEIVYWLVAGIVNVRAERAIAWPEAQAIAELKLSFIALSRNANRVKVAIISLSPLISGLALIWLISNNVLNLNVVIAVLRASGFDGIGDAIRLLLSTPDIWLWVYLMFTIANTMMPDSQTLRGWRRALIVIAVLVAALYVMGLAQQILLENLAQPITDGLNRLALIFAVVIVIDLLAIGVLGSIEALIERITGDSATFQNGKLVAVTREELQQQRAQERAKQERQRQPGARLPAGHPSVYKLPLPIPGAPGREPATPVVVSREEKATLPSGQTPPRRIEPSVIAGTAAVVKTDDELNAEAHPLQEAHIELPTGNPARRRQLVDEEDEELEGVDEMEDDASEDEEEEARL